MWVTDSVRKDQIIPDKALSLFEGIAGAVDFLQNLQEPKKAKFSCLMI